MEHHVLLPNRAADAASKIELQGADVSLAAELSVTSTVPPVLPN